MECKGTVTVWFQSWVLAVPPWHLLPVLCWDVIGCRVRTVQCTGEKTLPGHTSSVTINPDLDLVTGHAAASQILLG